MSDLLYFSERTLQEVCLAIMALTYTLRIIWFVKHKPGKERQAPTGATDTSTRKGILYSWANILMPWAMESTRTKKFLYAQFVVFHLGVIAAIALSFIIPYGPGLLESKAFVTFIQILTGAACVVGILRIIRRVSSVYLRAISSPDDYFATLLLTVWFFFATLAAPNNITGGEGIILTYFLLTAFFLLYVPHSKISHYLYYPFTRYYLGKSLGYRGSYPVRRGPQPTP